MLLEHALLASGDIAETGSVYAGWPARQIDERRLSEVTVVELIDDHDRYHSEKTKGKEWRRSVDTA